MASEKDILLAVASPAEWRKWASDPYEYEPECLLCQAYDDCNKCKSAGGHPGTDGCSGGTSEASVAAIARLKRAGIWED